MYIYNVYTHICTYTFEKYILLGIYSDFWNSKMAFETMLFEWIVLDWDVWIFISKIMLEIFEFSFKIEVQIKIKQKNKKINSNENRRKNRPRYFLRILQLHFKIKIFLDL